MTTETNTRCMDCGSELRCEGCAQILAECDCVFSLSYVNAPDMYCPNCDPLIHRAAQDLAEYHRREEALLRQTDIDNGYDFYGD